MWRIGKVTLVAAIVLLTAAGCAINVPVGLLPSTVPIDDINRINLVGKETFGDSCQWRLQLGGYVFPLGAEGNQNYLALDRAFGDEYDGLVEGTVDEQYDSFGISWPIVLRLASSCRHIRGRPFVFTKPLKGAR
ncbi:MAG: hypothetical protein ACE5FL_05540 [Myxococcota bacterium]